jgi:hypothetical protein
MSIYSQSQFRHNFSGCSDLYFEHIPPQLVEVNYGTFCTDIHAASSINMMLVLDTRLVIPVSTLDTLRDWRGVIVLCGVLSTSKVVVQEGQLCL